ncbi:MAG: gamma-glutamyl-gamma-aminobutyrate hydrolase family protein [Bacteroidota bacterium]|nr:gamma-glutamyl-gamma-aminobutyrate hydrolase family protein [Bacteroidota bacterium]
MQNVIFIGITDSEASYANYPLWIKNDDPCIKIIKLTPDNYDVVNHCSAIILSGGIDTHPKFYNNKRINYPNAPEAFNEQRDEYEIIIFQLSQKIGLPVLAICRGMQLVNVCMGGTLIQDLEENNKSNHRKQNNKDGIHNIKIEKDSYLFTICKTELATVNSAHHQGLDTIAPEFRVSAWSHDGVAEVIERKDRNNHPFFLGVQGHPERFAQIQPNDILTSNIRSQFINAAKNNFLCKS